MEAGSRYPLTEKSKMAKLQKMRREQRLTHDNVKVLLQKRYRDLMLIKHQLRENRKAVDCCNHHNHEKRNREDVEREEILDHLKKLNIDVAALPENSMVIQKFKELAAQRKRAEQEQMLRRECILKKLIDEHRAQMRSQRLKIPKISKPKPKIPAVDFCKELAEKEGRTATKPKKKKADYCKELAEKEARKTANVTEEHYEVNFFGEEAEGEQELPEEVEVEEEVMMTPEEEVMVTPEEEPPAVYVHDSDVSCLCNKKRQICELGETGEEECYSITSPRISEIHVKLSIDYDRQLGPPDGGLAPRPALLHFRDYRSLHSYRKRFTVVNISLEVVWCRFHSIEILNDDIDPNELELQPVEQQRIAPGLASSFVVSFRPRHIYGELRAVAHFATHRTRTSNSNINGNGNGNRSSGGGDRCNVENHRKPLHGVGTRGHFAVPIRCTVQGLKVQITPSEVNFRPVPIWKFAEDFPPWEKETKHIMVRNTSRIDCELSIRRKNAPELVTETHREEGEEGESVTSSVDPFFASLFDECLAPVFDCFRFDSYHARALPPAGSLELRAQFVQPAHVGAHSANFALEFRDPVTWQVLYETDIRLTLRTLPPPLTLHPVAFDFGACALAAPEWGAVGGGLLLPATPLRYRDSFVTHNMMSRALRVTASVPKELRRYVKVAPRRTILQGSSSITMTVHFQPDASLARPSGANRYYDPTSGVLEFPISVVGTPTTTATGRGGGGGCKAGDDCPPDRVTVYALLTFGLTIAPQYVDLGTVNTQETVYVDLKVTNESVLFQTSVFPAVPKCISLGPAYGIGDMLPKETVTYRMYFSPRACDIRGNELGTPGKRGYWSYDLECKTVNDLNPKKLLFEEELLTTEPLTSNTLTTDVTPMDFQLADFREWQARQPEDGKFSDVLKQDVAQRTNSQAEFPCSDQDIFGPEILTKVHEPLDDNSYMLKSDTVSSSAEERSVSNNEDKVEGLYDDEYFDEFIEEEPCEDEEIKPLPMVSVVMLTAVIEDNLCELSHQLLVLPDCSLGGVTLGRVQLRGTNLETLSRYDCGKRGGEKPVRDLCEVFKFEFAASADEIDISPRYGEFNAYDVIDVRVRATPVLTDDKVRQKARDLKKNAILQERREVERARIMKQREVDRKLEEKRILKELIKQAKDEEKRLQKLEKESKKAAAKNKRTASASKNKKEKKGKKGGESKKSPRATSKGTTAKSVVEKKIEIPPELLPPVLPEPRDSELDISHVFTEDELKVTEQEMLESKKLIQHTMETVTVDEHVLCRIRSSKDREENLRLRVVYKLRRPYFLLDLDDEGIDFGPVVIGDRRQALIRLHNTSDDVITPVITKMRHDDQFRYHLSHDCAVRPEESLVIPVTFVPSINGTVTNAIMAHEYLTVSYKTSLFRVYLCGRTVEPDLIFKPEFRICRFADCQAGKAVTLAVDVVNNCEAAVPLKLVVDYEIEGTIRDKPIELEKEQEVAEEIKGAVEDVKSRSASAGAKDRAGKKDKSPSNKKDRGKSKEKPLKKGNKAKEQLKKKKKKDKLSTEFYEDETYSIENNFDFISGSDEEVFSATQLPNDVLNPFEKKTLKIVFRPPGFTDKEGKDKSKKGGKKGSKGSRSGSKSSKSSKKSAKSGKKSDKSSKKSEKAGKKSEKSSKKSDKSSKKSDKTVVDEVKKSYLGKYSLVLGTGTCLREYFCLCTMK